MSKLAKCFITSQLVWIGIGSAKTTVGRDGKPHSSQIFDFVMKVCNCDC